MAGELESIGGTCEEAVVGDVRKQWCEIHESVGAAFFNSFDGGCARALVEYFREDWWGLYKRVSAACSRKFLRLLQERWLAGFDVGRVRCGRPLLLYGRDPWLYCNQGSLPYNSNGWSPTRALYHTLGTVFHFGNVRISYW